MYILLHLFLNLCFHFNNSKYKKHIFSKQMRNVRKILITFLVVLRNKPTFISLMCLTFQMQVPPTAINKRESAHKTDTIIHVKKTLKQYS